MVEFISNCWIVLAESLPPYLNLPFTTKWNILPDNLEKRGKDTSVANISFLLCMGGSGEWVYGVFEWWYGGAPWCGDHGAVTMVKVYQYSMLHHTTGPPPPLLGGCSRLLGDIVRLFHGFNFSYYKIVECTGVYCWRNGLERYIYGKNNRLKTKSRRRNGYWWSWCKG